jgi:hypothetical protein
MKRLALLMAALTVPVLLVAPSATANDTLCTGALAGAHDNVIVPDGATCNIAGAQIKGNVKVLAGGSLDVFAPTTIGGSVQADPGHQYVRIWGGAVVVMGDVEVKGGTGAPDGGTAGYLAGTDIRGNFQWEENRIGLNADGGTIGGNVKAEKNAGGGFISGNTIRGNVECKENNPAIGEAGNTIGGDDKCPE